MVNCGQVACPAGFFARAQAIRARAHTHRYYLLWLSNSMSLSESDFLLWFQCIL